MRLQINGKWEVLPTSLSEYTLGRRIEYENQVGKELNAELTEIQEMEEGFEKEIKELEWQNKKMVRTLAFFLNATPEAITESLHYNELIQYYKASAEVIFNEEQEMALQREFLWNDEMWYLHSPELKNGDKMTFAEISDSKQIVKDLIELGANQWEYILPLCAIFLRRKDEKYHESFLYEGSERMEMMKGLPMDIAMQVGFFFLPTVNTYINISRSSGRQKSEIRERIQNSTLRSLAG